MKMKTTGKDRGGWSGEVLVRLEPFFKGVHFQFAQVGGITACVSGTIILFAD